MNHIFDAPIALFYELLKLPQYKSSGGLAMFKAAEQKGVSFEGLKAEISARRAFKKNHPVAQAVTTSRYSEEELKKRRWFND